MSDADDIIKKLNRFVVNTNKAIDDAVRITAHRVQVTAIKSIREPSKGTIYTNENGGIRHISSKPGEAPNVDTGRLIGSITVDHNKGSMRATVGTGVDYGAFLELIMDRPWLQPALDDNISSYEATLKLVIDKQIRTANR
jgi:phage gpG-like protein